MSTLINNLTSPPSNFDFYDNVNYTFNPNGSVFLAKLQVKLKNNGLTACLRNEVSLNEGNYQSFCSQVLS